MKKLFWGLFFIVAGAFVITNQMGYYTNIDLFSLLCTIFLIPILLTSLFKVNFPGILFSLAFLCIIYSEPLHLGSITPIPVLLTALLGSIGLSILFNRHSFYVRHHSSHNHDHCSQVINDVDGEEVNLNNSFCSSIKYINSDNFKVANLKSSFGEMRVYFDKAKIEGDSATINLDVSFSGVELYIPKEWKVINKVDTTLGDIDPKNPNNGKTEKTITLTGRVSLSGVQIIYI